VATVTWKTGYRSGSVWHGKFLIFPSLHRLQLEAAQLLVASLNAPTGTITANAAIVPAGTSGAINVLATNDTDLVIYMLLPPAGTGYAAVHRRAALHRNARCQRDGEWMRACGTGVCF